MQKLYLRIYAQPTGILHRYTASKYLQNWEADLRATDLNEREKLAALDEVEAEINAGEYRLATGINAVFGGVYQLLNSSADEFLHIQKNTSEEDNTALKASLGERDARSKMTWFKIKPGKHSYVSAAKRKIISSWSAANFSC